MNTQLILGSLETVSLPELGIDDVLAKVDTGAFSGALHCTDIRVERHGEEHTLYFTPLGKDSLATQTTEFKEIIVRTANGHESVRYVIPAVVELRGQRYRTLIGLSDRTVMMRDMLLGRRFLLENNAIVDVSLSKDIDTEAERIEEDDE
jgi:hypothetical protein